MKKRLISILLILMMALSVTPMPALAEQTIPTSGTCGESVTWAWDAQTHLLTFSGTGAMYDYDDDTEANYAPWWWIDLRSDVQRVIVEEGITYVGNNAFSYLYNMVELTLPASLTKVGSDLFYMPNGPMVPVEKVHIPNLEQWLLVENCGNVQFPLYVDGNAVHDIVIPESLTVIPDQYLYNADWLESVIIHSDVTSIGDSAFSQCQNLETVVFQDCDAELGNQVFDTSSNPSVVLHNSDLGLSSSTFGQFYGNIYVIGGSWNEENMLTYGGGPVWCTNVPSLYTTEDSQQFYQVGDVIDPANIHLGYLFSDGYTCIAPYAPEKVTLGAYDNSTPGQKTVSVRYNGFVCDYSYQVVSDLSAEEIMVTYLGEVPTYTGKPQKPVPVVSYQNVELMEGRDYTVTYENNINATDEAYIVITGCGSYEGLTLLHPFTILPYDLANLNNLDLIDTIPYSEPLKYTKAIIDENYNILIEGEDYLLRFMCIGEGDAWGRVYIYGLGNYTGSNYSHITISYDNSGEEDPEISEGQTLRVYPRHDEQGKFTIFKGDSILCLIQTEESKYFIPKYQLYEFVDGDPENIKLVEEKTYLSADVNTTNKFEYQFTSPGTYGLVAVWEEYTKSSYVDSNGKVIYTQEPNGIAGKYSAVIEVRGSDNETDTDITESRYGWIESVEPSISYVGPRRILLELITSPYRAIIADSYDVSIYGPAPDRSGDYLYLNDAGVYTIKAHLNELEEGTYEHTVTWEIEVPEWDITDGGRIEVFDPETNTAQVTFGGEKLVSDNDYSLSVYPVEGTDLVKVSITGKNLFKGTLSRLYYADTGNPYYCEHSDCDAMVTEPTCTESGYTTYTCTFCGHTYIADETSALGHSYKAVVTKPTCTKDGYTTYTCTACDESYVDENSYSNALGHKWKGSSCENCGAIRDNPFTDVPADAFYYDPVMWAVENGITTGTSDTTFSPNNPCQRAAVVTFLWRAAGEPEPTSANNPFDDVKETDFFYKAVLWAVENGITNGTDAAHFSPYAVCNRAAVVTFLHRAMGSPTPESQENPFTDVDEKAFYYAPMLWAVEQGVTNGLTETTFGPTADCNRAQIVTFLYRAYNN